MLVEAVNWPPARNHSREHILAFPDFAHYVTGWPRDGDLGVSVGRENLARRLAALYPQDVITGSVIDGELAPPAVASGGNASQAIDNLGGAVEAYLSSHFSGFPNVPNNVVKLSIRIDKVISKSTFTFNGPTAMDGGSVDEMGSGHSITGDGTVLPSSHNVTSAVKLPRFRKDSRGLWRRTKQIWVVRTLL
jgi:hypothetical protein